MDIVSSNLVQIWGRSCTNKFVLGQMLKMSDLNCSSSGSHSSHLMIDNARAILIMDRAEKMCSPHTPHLRTSPQPHTAWVWESGNVVQLLYLRVIHIPPCSRTQVGVASAITIRNVGNITGLGRFQVRHCAPRSYARWDNTRHGANIGDIVFLMKRWCKTHLNWTSLSIKAHQTVGW
jgi:hypothetical protein